MRETIATCGPKKAPENSAPVKNFKPNPITQQFYKRKERSEGSGVRACRELDKRINGEISLQEDYIRQDKKNEPEAEDAFDVQREQSLIDISMGKSEDSSGKLDKLVLNEDESDGLALDDEQSPVTPDVNVDFLFKR